MELDSSCYLYRCVQFTKVYISIHNSLYLHNYTQYCTYYSSTDMRANHVEIVCHTHTQRTQMHTHTHTHTCITHARTSTCIHTIYKTPLLYATYPSLRLLYIYPSLMLLSRFSLKKRQSRLEGPPCIGSFPSLSLSNDINSY